MRPTEMMTAGGVTLAGLGVLAGLAIGSGEGKPKAVDQRRQAVEVRTQIIRRTVNVYRHAHPHRVAGGGSPSASPGPSGRVAAAAYSRPVTAAPAYSPPATVRTRSSGGASGDDGGNGDGGRDG